MSDLRAANIKGRTGEIAPNLPSGMNASGVTTAIDMVVGGGTTTTGPVRIDNTLGAGVTLNTSGVIAAGIITAAQFKGDGSELTGVSGFSTALSNDTTSLLNQIFKTTVQHNIAAGTSITIQTRPAFNYLDYGFRYSVPGCTFATAHCNSALDYSNVDDGSCQFIQRFYQDTDGDGYLDIDEFGEPIPCFDSCPGEPRPVSLNPVTGLLQVASSAITNTPSAQEYDSYSDAQKLEINKAYGPGGVMEGYNAVSQFGKGALATVEKRIEDRASLGIFDDTTEKLNNLAESLGGNRIDPPAYDFDDRSDQEQMTFDLDKADEAFAETGDYDEYSGIDTGFTGPDYGSITSGTVFDAEDEEDYSTSPTVDTTATPAYDFDDDFYDSEPAPAPSPAPAPASDPRDRGGGGGGGGGNGKIVCTMMNETYGFGSFRNKIWIKYAQDNFTPEYEKGYHKIFLPLVSYAKKKGVTNKIVRKILEHIAVHRTIDIRQESRGKTHMLGRVYRKVLEPICYLVGKYGKR